MARRELPAITGYQLIRLLEKGGWSRGSKARHGLRMSKWDSDIQRTRVTVIPSSRASLPEGTLGAILGPKQTGLGKKGLDLLIREHGIK
jgi:predicted RNA binding protein YcfA (HicA-like mRNA interferase family)